LSVLNTKPYEIAVKALLDENVKFRKIKQKTWLAMATAPMEVIRDDQILTEKDHRYNNQEIRDCQRILWIGCRDWKASKVAIYFRLHKKDDAWKEDFKAKYVTKYDSSEMKAIREKIRSRVKISVSLESRKLEIILTIV
jgi:hypothetical protein